jgi:26S proteasome non-ATPase regulatory subunit 9
MNTSLLTFDGFPRADIDVAQIRTTRARIIQLKNDHKTAMRQLEEAVHKQFATGKAIDNAVRDDSPRITNNSTPSAPSGVAPTTVAHQPPFARINAVSPGGPAERAGLQPEDRLVVFGSVNFTNHERLGKVAQVVQQNENVSRYFAFPSQDDIDDTPQRPILVKVLRQGADQAAPELVELRLTPQRDWGGRGLLGCHLLPIS